jgi:methylglyoxal synthase
MNNKKRIALVAHADNRADLINWAYRNRHILSQHDLVATKRTGAMLEGTLNAVVTKLESGALGGHQQLAAMINDGQIDIIIFFYNPMEEGKNDSDVTALQQIAEDNSIIIATNRATADFILSSTLMDKVHPISGPDHSAYLKRIVRGGTDLKQAV